MDNKIQLGEYKLVKQFGKLFLEILVPGKWLNDSSRVYPITIDPIVTGPVSNYPSGKIISSDIVSPALSVLIGSFII